MSEPSNVPPALRAWLAAAVELQASDLHLIANHPPVLRVNGDLNELPEAPLDPAEVYAFLRSVCTPDALARLMAKTDVDFSLELLLDGKRARFRVNLFKAEGHLGGCLRLIPPSVPTFDWAGFPVPLADRIVGLRDGLVIVAGATGSGKTTTLAMIVNRLHKAGGQRIITVEEPIEYRFARAANSVVTQREVGRDVPTFADGLKYGLRQDPDVILVGEIRDRETAQMALSAAETGHLVLTTLHTRDAKGAVTRFADLFPQDAQRDVRGQLAMGLRAVIAQRLLPGANRGDKRQLCLEVMWNTHPIASAIRNGKIESIDNYLVTGREEGMIGFDESVRQLYRAGRITRATAEQHVTELSVLNR
ncbi:MAG: PilT/PilU family type 4a pilus ATPase [Gemmataceae bacterium]